MPLNVLKMFSQTLTKLSAELENLNSLIVLVKSIIVGNISTIKMIEMDAKTRLHKLELGFICGRCWWFFLQEIW